jgi:hypothetical protein
MMLPRKCGQVSIGPRRAPSPRLIHELLPEGFESIRLFRNHDARVRPQSVLDLPRLANCPNASTEHLRISQKPQNAHLGHAAQGNGIVGASVKPRPGRVVVRVSLGY